MELFDRHRLEDLLQCPKCVGLGRPFVRWKDTESGITESGRDWWNEEHLEVGCVRCGWSFEMAPADQARTEK